MAHKLGQGSSKNNRDSNPQYLGVKLFAGQQAKAGNILIRQRGSKFRAGENVRKGSDDTLYAIKSGIVKFTAKKIMSFHGSKIEKKFVSIIAD